MIKKEKPKFKIADFQMKIFREDEVLDLRTMGGNEIIEELEHNMSVRETPIDKRIKKKFNSIK